MAPAWPGAGAATIWEHPGPPRSGRPRSQGSSSWSVPAGRCDDGALMTTTELPPRRAYRDAHAPVLGGVAGGLARHLGVPVLWVRVAFLVGAAAGGLGIVLYAGLWLVLPTDA